MPEKKCVNTDDQSKSKPLYRRIQLRRHLCDYGTGPVQLYRRQTPSIPGMQRSETPSMPTHALIVLCVGRRRIELEISLDHLVHGIEKVLLSRDFGPPSDGEHAGLCRNTA